MPVTKTNTDPMGQAMLDYLQGNQKAEILVHADVAEPDPVPMSYFFRTWEEMPESEQTAINNSRGKVLDIGAGSGCHSLVLQERGLDLTAIDISQLSVDVMRERGLKNVLVADAFKFTGGPYDTILMLMNGIGIAKTLEGLAQFLEHCKTLLAPGGQLLLDSADIRYMYEEGDGSVRYDMKREYHGEILYWVEYRGVVGDPFYWLYVSSAKLAEVAEKHGYNCKVLVEEENHHYLAELTLK